MTTTLPTEPLPFNKWTAYIRPEAESTAKESIRHSEKSINNITLPFTHNEDECTRNIRQ